MADPGAPRPARPEDAALRAIVEGVEAETGEEFFASLVRHLASALDARYAFVSELSADGRRFRTRALWGRGGLLANIESPLAGTPCEAVLGGDLAHHADGLQERFPDDPGLVDWGVVSYAGVPLVDAGGAVVGHLAILDDRPMPDGGRVTAVMRIFAARARAEIDRLRAEAALRDSEARLSSVLESALDAIVTTDADGRIVLFNAAAEKVFRCPAAGALGAPLERFLTAGFQRALARARQAIDDGGSAPPYVWAPEGLLARAADGREFPIEATISRATVGGTRLYTLILRDVDERRRAEQEVRQLLLDNEYLREELRAVHNVDAIVGESRAMKEVGDQLRLVAGTDATVLILGETGTGKELIARAVHAQSPRRARPLVKVNCAALPTGLIESELFGHEKGAFTNATERRVGRFELAHRGTIFLDEIGELPAEVQVKLLRVLQEHEFERVGGSRTITADVRVIAATNRDLAAAVARETFRQDLYYRLNVFPLRLPPLREHREDVPLLVHYFASRAAAKIGRRITHVPRDTMQRLVAYSWPGNVRELEHVIERAVILSTGPELEVAPEALPAARAESPAPAEPAAGSPALAEVERQHIVSVLKRTRWRISGPEGAARILNLHPNTLRSRMQRLGIRRSGEERS